MPDRQCAGCTHQVEWGCEAKRWREDAENDTDPKDAWVNPAVIPLVMDGEDDYACPRQSLREHPHAWRSILDYYAMYTKGFLPQAGAVVDQSNRAVQVFRVLDTVNGEIDAQPKPPPPTNRNVQPARSPGPRPPPAEPGKPKPRQRRSK